MRSPNIRYLPAIDHLRAFAAVLIVLYHGTQLLGYEIEFHGPSGFLPWPRARNIVDAFLVEGHTAVAMFMVLSGFIFTFGAGDRDVRFRPFLRNRILRIYPLLVFLIIVGTAWYPSRFRWRGLLQTLLCMGNLRGGLDLGVFSAMFWTVAVEFQFYLLFPLLHRLMLRRGPGALAGLIPVMLAARLIAWGLGSDPLALTYTTIVGRLDQFLVGMLAGHVWVRHGAAWQRQLRWSLGPAIILTGCVLLGFNRLGGAPADAPWKLAWPLLEGALWATVMLCWIAVADLLPARLSKALAALGMISYSVYLLHFPLIHAVVVQGWYMPLALAPRTAALVNTLLVVLPAVLLVSTVTYQVIERPFLRRRARYLDSAPSVASASVSPTA